MPSVCWWCDVFRNCCNLVWVSCKVITMSSKYQHTSNGNYHRKKVWGQEQYLAASCSSTMNLQHMLIVLSDSDPYIFQKSRSQLQVFGVIRVTWQVPYQGLTVLDWPVNLTVIWCFLPSACELIYLLVCEGIKWNNYAENSKFHHKKFSCLEFVHSWHLTSKHMSQWLLRLLIEVNFSWLPH
jgi:hypothetical protein